MELNILSKTCSMAELGNVRRSDVNSSSRFKREVDKLVRAKNAGRGNAGGVFAVIYNTNYTDRALVSSIKGAGFKAAGRYKGHAAYTVLSFIKYFRQPKAKKA